MHTRDAREFNFSMAEWGMVTAMNFWRTSRVPYSTFWISFRRMARVRTHFLVDMLAETMDFECEPSLMAHQSTLHTLQRPDSIVHLRVLCAVCAVCAVYDRMSVWHAQLGFPIRGFMNSFKSRWRICCVCLRRCGHERRKVASLHVLWVSTTEPVPQTHTHQPNTKCTLNTNNNNKTSEKKEEANGSRARPMSEPTNTQRNNVNTLWDDRLWPNEWQISLSMYGLFYMTIIHNSCVHSMSWHTLIQSVAGRSNGRWWLAILADTHTHSHTQRISLNSHQYTNTQTRPTGAQWPNQRIFGRPNELSIEIFGQSKWSGIYFIREHFTFSLRRFYKLLRLLLVRLPSIFSYFFFSVVVVVVVVDFVIV